MTERHRAEGAGAESESERPPHPGPPLLVSEMYRGGINSIVCASKILEYSYGAKRPYVEISYALFSS